MEFTFPDSKRTVEVDGVNFLTLSMIRGRYEKEYPGKPQVPTIQIDDVVEPNPNDEKYQKDLKEWATRMNMARWAAAKLYYASCLKTIDESAVEKAVRDVSSFIDLRQEVLNGYAELQVPFNPDLMDKYIYLFHVCITNTAEQALFENALLTGSAPTQEAVQQATFRLRGQI